MKTTSKMSLVLAVIAAAAVVPSLARAQSASINATADVQMALTVAGTQPLSFGAAFPGTTRTVLATDAASAGYLTLTGALNAEVSYSFTAIPANLTYLANNLPVTFNAAWSYLNDGTGQTAIGDMAAGATTRLGLADGLLYVFVGGSISPTTEPAGTYTGSLTLTAAYTGN